MSASFAILKHCIPNGMPIIVIQSKRPFNMADTANGIPLIISHKIFASRIFCRGLLVYPKSNKGVAQDGVLLIYPACDRLSFFCQGNMAVPVDRDISFLL